MNQAVEKAAGTGRQGPADRRSQRRETERLRVETLNRACLYLERNFERDVSLEELGTEVGWSPSHLQRVFRGRLGVSPKEYVQALRVSRMKEELRGGRRDGASAESRGDAYEVAGEVSGGNVTRAIFESGFGSVSTGHETVVRHLGMTPATYGTGGRGARIEYCAARCSLGWLMVGRTKRGICSLTLGDDPDALFEELQAEFPEAGLVAADGSMGEICERLVAVADRGEDARDLPLEVRATDFQWRVWRAMRQIPPGETRSYSELAEMAGYPKATRAVGTACARNPVSLLIPCHRVVRADGSLGNYAWGRERKKSILEAEGFDGACGQAPAGSRSAR